MARLVVVPTPLGNLGDLSDRVRQSLAESPLWVVEDTRVSGRLAAALELSPSYLVLNDHTKPARLPEFIARIEETEQTALLTDAGTPAISDPGSVLVDLAVSEGIEVDALPGPSAVTLALSVSGFFAQRFVFLGFLPRKRGDITSILEPYAGSTMTLAGFESPHRIGKLAAVAAEVLGDRRVMVGRELTKKHQQLWRGNLTELAQTVEIPAKGELTYVIEGHRR